MGFSCDPGLGTIGDMDLLEWVEEAEALLRRDGVWPEQNEERARGVLEEAALQGPEPFVRAMRALRRELRERDADAGDPGPGPRWVTFGRP